MRVLITGSSGFVAGHLLKELADRDGYDIIGIDKIEANIGDRGDSFLQVDLADSSCLAMLEHALIDVDVVVNLAAESFVHTSSLYPELYVQSNVLATFNLLQAMRSQNKTARLIHFSTCEVYGNTGNTGVHESGPLKPLSPYAGTKLAGEALVSSYAHTYQMQAIVVRPFNLYGPGQQRNRLVPSLVRRLKAGEPVDITGDGQQTRDWVHVDDAVDLLIRLINMSDLRSPLILNAASGVATSVLSIACQVAELAGRRMEILHQDRPAGALLRSVGSPDETELTVGWIAQTDLAKGLAATVGQLWSGE